MFLTDRWMVTGRELALPFKGGVVHGAEGLPTVVFSRLSWPFVPTRIKVQKRAEARRSTAHLNTDKIEGGTDGCVEAWVFGRPKGGVEIVRIVRMPCVPVASFQGLPGFRTLQGICNLYIHLSLLRRTEVLECTCLLFSKTYDSAYRFVSFSHVHKKI